MHQDSLGQHRHGITELVGHVFVSPSKVPTIHSVIHMQNGDLFFAA